MQLEVYRHEKWHEGPHDRELLSGFEVEGLGFRIYSLYVEL